LEDGRTVRGDLPCSAICRFGARDFRERPGYVVGSISRRRVCALRQRITWDRISNPVTSREGAKKLAIANGGTIPDRGLYGVFMTGGTRGARVGELDEEMVFESSIGDTIILGASTWRVDEITHDRVSVSPAPGAPVKMPFWRGDTPGRSAEFGQKVGELTRELLQLPRPVAHTRLIEDHNLDGNAAENLLAIWRIRRLPPEKFPANEISLSSAVATNWEIARVFYNMGRPLRKSC